MLLAILAMPTMAEVNEKFVFIFFVFKYFNIWLIDWLIDSMFGIWPFEQRTE